MRSGFLLVFYLKASVKRVLDVVKRDVKGLAGKLDIDRPLATYNVTPKAFWGHKQDARLQFSAAVCKEWWPKITARHLLTHTSGLGNGPPGRKFEYNSGEHIQCLE